MRRSSKEIAGEIFLLRILVPHSCPAFSFPNSVWERTFAKLCFAGLSRRETEFRERGFPNRSLGTRRRRARPALVPHSRFASFSSFPNSVWERTFAKLCFAGLSRRETEFRERGFPNRSL